MSSYVPACYWKTITTAPESFSVFVRFSRIFPFLIFFFYELPFVLKYRKDKNENKNSERLPFIKGASVKYDNDGDDDNNNNSNGATEPLADSYLFTIIRIKSVTINVLWSLFCVLGRSLQMKCERKTENEPKIIGRWWALCASYVVCSFLTSSSTFFPPFSSYIQSRSDWNYLRNSRAMQKIFGCV